MCFQERLQDIRQLLIVKRYGLEEPSQSASASSNDGGPDEDTALKTGFTVTTYV